MTCEICKKEMLFFVDGQTCGWKCNYCDNMIVTTYNDEIEFDETLYNISILPTLKPSAIEIKSIAKICNCSFINAKELLISGGFLGEFDAVKARENIHILISLGIHFQSSPEFLHSI